MADPLFLAAYPFAKDVLTLPTRDLDQTAAWYSSHFGLTQEEQLTEPKPQLIMSRDGARIGFQINGGDPEQDGAAILVSDIDRAHAELTANGCAPGDFRIDDRDGQSFKVFFVIAPDGLCYYFHQPVSPET